MKRKTYSDGKYSGTVHLRDVEVGAHYYVENGCWTFTVLKKEGEMILVKERYSRGKNCEHWINTEKDIYFLNKTL